MTGGGGDSATVGGDVSLTGDGGDVTFGGGDVTFGGGDVDRSDLGVDGLVGSWFSSPLLIQVSMTGFSFPLRRCTIR